MCCGRLWHDGCGVTLRDAIERLVDLLEAHEGAGEGDAGAGADNFECEGCTDCVACRFCVACVACERCSYCEASEGLVDCTHCRASVDCEACSHVAHGRALRDCRYVVLCFDCEGCTHCFGCVGLRDAEFCFLNEPLPRKVYFERVRAMEAALSRLETAGVLLAFEDDLDRWLERVDAATRGPSAPASPDPGGEAAVSDEVASVAAGRPRHGSVRTVRRPARLDAGGGRAQKPDP